MKHIKATFEDFEVEFHIGSLGVTVQMWAIGTLAIACLGFLLGAGA